MTGSDGVVIREHPPTVTVVLYTRRPDILRLRNVLERGPLDRAVISEDLRTPVVPDDEKLLSFTFPRSLLLLLFTPRSLLVPD